MSDFIAAILELFSTVLSADKSMTENSRVGESEWDRKARDYWARYGAVCLILLILLAMGGGAFWLWN